MVEGKYVVMKVSKTRAIRKEWILYYCIISKTFLTTRESTFYGIFAPFLHIRKYNWEVNENHPCKNSFYHII